MEQAAENLEFERAADLRDRLKAARKVIEQEKVGYHTQVDQDVLDEADDIAEWLRQVKGRKVELGVPRRGEKRRIVELATKNARDTLDQQKAEWAADTEK